MDEFTIDHLMRCSPQREDGTPQRWALAREWVLGLSLILVCQCALAQATYRIQPIGFRAGCTGSGPPIAAGLNESGQVTGQACDAFGDEQAYLWRNNGTPIVNLGPPEPSSSYAIGINASGMVGGTAEGSGGTFAFLSSGDGKSMTRIYDAFGGDYAAAYAVNDRGQLTGEGDLAGLASHAFLWKNDGSPMIDLGSPLGGNYSYGEAINESGEVAGIAFRSGDTGYDAVVWKSDGTSVQDLGTLGGAYGLANLINASGQVAGSSTVPTRTGPDHAFFWRNDGRPMQDLGTLGGSSSSPSALNDAGQLVGSADLPAKRVSHAFIWKNDGSPMQDLGTLGGTQSAANYLNSSGQVTGNSSLAGDAVYHAFLWKNDGTKMQDVNNLIDPSDPLKSYVTLTSGDFINDRGDIVADGNDSRTGLGVYLLTSTAVTTSVITLTPRSLAFGSISLDSSSAGQLLTVTNTSANTVAVTSIALRGTAPKQFAFTDDCGKSLAARATCKIKVTFKPTTKGAKTAYLDVNGGGGGLRTVRLTGTGE